MEAGNIAELNRMEADLVAVLGSPPVIGLATSQTQAAIQVFQALQSLTEFPIKFNWWDQHDGFDDAQMSQAFWQSVGGGIPTMTGNGRALPAGTNMKPYFSLRSGYIDANVTAAISVTPQTTSTSAQMGVTAKMTSDSNFLCAAIVNNGAGGWSFFVFTQIGNVFTNIGSVSLSSNPTGQQTVWVQLQTVDDTVTATLYSQDPNVVSNPTVLAGPIVVNLTGVASQQLGAGQPGFCGLYYNSNPGITSWAWLDWRVDAIYPCDFVINARTVQSPAISHTAESTTGTRFTRGFQFAVRASDPRILCPVAVTKTIPLTTGPGIALGRSYSRSYPLRYTTPTLMPTNQQVSQSGTSPQEIVVINRGTWVGRPVITINGGITNPVLVNYSTGKTFVLDGTIAQGDSVQIDAFNHTLTNAAGNSVMGMFDPQNQRWPELQPGDNVLQLLGSNPVGSPSATIAYNSAWI
jgi:hypothetical protein